jgi:hypothetical protein
MLKSKQINRSDTSKVLLKFRFGDFEYFMNLEMESEREGAIMNLLGESMSK